MSKRGFWELHDLSDDELDAGLRLLLSRSRGVEARIVAHLAEVDARRTHARAGISLFAYCLRQLSLSEMEAFYRITAARLARKFPLIFELLETGRLHITGLCLLRRHLTRANHRELLELASGKSKRQIERLLAIRFPRADVPDRVQRIEPLSAGRYRLELTISEQLKQKLELALDLTAHSNPERCLEPLLDRAIDLLIERVQARRFGAKAAPRHRVRAPVSPEAESVIETPLISKSPIAELTQAESPHTAPACVADAPTGGSQSASSHAEALGADSSIAPLKSQIPAIPEAFPAETPAGGAGKSGPSSKGRAATSSRKRAHIKHDARREVAKRDGICCSFVASDGTRCESRAFLQLHHEHAWANGGSDGADNLKFLCATHNRLLAEQEFGKDHIEQAIERRQHLYRNKRAS